MLRRKKRLSDLVLPFLFSIFYTWKILNQFKDGKIKNYREKLNEKATQKRTERKIN